MRQPTRRPPGDEAAWCARLAGAAGGVVELLWSVRQPVVLVRLADGALLAGNAAYARQGGEAPPALAWRAGSPVLDGWQGRRVRVGGEECLLALRLEDEPGLALDSLTGLVDRAELTRQAERALARAQGSGAAVALALIDLDGFKRVNDELGPAEGDRVLAAAAECLRRTVRPEDTVARLGGDEFVVLAESIADDASALAFAERLRAELALALRGTGGGHVASGSIGIAVGHGADESPDAMLRDADAAMHEAKASGRDRAVLFDTGLRARLRARAVLESDLRRAVVGVGGELTVALQPVVELATGRLVGAEALARWRDPARGPVAPLDFVSAAERTGLIARLGARVLAETCRQALLWRRERPEQPMWWAVNVSPWELQAPGFTEAVLDALAEARLPAEDLRLEITETALVEHFDQVCGALGRLRERGVKIMLDDFGTGMSSLSHLKHLPVDTLKLDRTFIHQMPTSKDRFIVASVVHMARLTGLEVIAEGVERDRDVRLLRALRCHLAQGHRYARPLTGPELRALPEVLGPPPLPQRRREDTVPPAADRPARLAGGRFSRRPGAPQRCV